MTEVTCASGSRCDNNGYCVYDQDASNQGLGALYTALIVVGCVLVVGLIVIVVVIVARKIKASKVEYVDGYALLNKK